MKLALLTLFLLAASAQEPQRRCHEKCIPVMTPQGIIYQCVVVCE